MTKLNSILIVMAVFVFSHALQAENNTKKLKQLLNQASLAIAFNQPHEKTKLINQICELLKDEIDPADPNVRDRIHHSTALHVAASYGDVDLISLLHELNASVDAMDVQGQTPLFAAVRKGHVPAIELLIRLGANIHVKNIYGRTPLQENLQPLAIASLVRGGANPNSVADSGETPLHIAALAGHVGAVVELLRLGANPNAIAAFRQTPLHRASERGHIAVIAPLASFGVNLDAISEQGNTPLHIAVNHSQSAVMAELLRLGANPNVYNLDGDTPLGFAVRKGSITAVALLIIYGADLPFNLDSLQIYKGIAQQRAARIVELCAENRELFDRSRSVPQRLSELLSYALADNDGFFGYAILEGQLFPGETVLHAAVRLKRNDVLKLVLDHMRSVQMLARKIDVTNEIGHTPLAFALTLRNFEAVNHLLDAGATPTIGDPSSLELTDLIVGLPDSILERIHWLRFSHLWRPLMQMGLPSDVIKYIISQVFALAQQVPMLEESLDDAAATGDIATITRLVRYGANPNALGQRSGMTPLQMVVQIPNAPPRDNFSLIVALARLGADFNTQSRNTERTAFQMAVAESHLSAINALVLYGVELNGIDPMHWTPLQDAIWQGRYAASALLIVLGADLPATDWLEDLRCGGMLRYLQYCWNNKDLFANARSVSARLALLLDHAVAAQAAQLAISVLVGQWQYGENVLHVAVRLNRNEVLQLLINDADSACLLESEINTPNANGHTPLGRALALGYFETANMLLNAGAWPTVGNPSALTLAHIIGVEQPVYDRIVWRSIYRYWQCLMQYLPADIVVGVIFSFIWQLHLPANIK